MKILEKTSDSVHFFSKYLLLVLVGSMSLVIIAQVFSRTFLGLSIYWSEEFARYCLIWITFIGASIAYKNIELAMFDLIIEKISLNWRWLYLIVLDIIVLTFIVITIYYGLLKIIEPTTLMNSSPALKLPIWIVYLSVPIGFTFMLIHNINFIFQKIKMKASGD